MICAWRIFKEIHNNDECFQLFCSIAAKGEAQGGWENDLIAGLTCDPELAGKIARHGADQEKHGRLFYALLKRRSLDPVRVPSEMDYGALLEAAGIGLARERLGERTPLSAEEILRYLIHSRVTERRASEEIERQRPIFGSDPASRDAGRTIAGDEARHLADCEQELLRYAERGYERAIAQTLARYAQTETRVFRDVSLAVTRRMGEILGWSWLRGRMTTSEIHAAYARERVSGRRRWFRRHGARDGAHPARVQL